MFCLLPSLFTNSSPVFKFPKTNWLFFMFLFPSDGLHLTAEGNAVVHKEVVRVFSNAYLRAEEMTYDFPHHSEINGENVEKIFQQRS